MHEPGRPSSRPNPTRLLALGGILLVVAACGQAVVAVSMAAPSDTATRAAASLSPASDATAVPSGPAFVANPAPAGPDQASPAPSPAPGAAAGGAFPGGFLIADRGNGRLLAVDRTGKVWWRFPTSVAGAVPAGQAFAADDAFLAPDGLTIVANDESHQVIDRIDIATGKIVWQYGHYDRAGSGAGFLHTPDDAYPLANGDIVVADIENCRVMEISPAKQVVHQWGRTRACAVGAPATYGRPNGDTPLPDGGILITEIAGSRVVRLAADGHVIFDIHVPVRYPSDAQLDSAGNVIVADYASPGAVVRVSPTGTLLWRYGPSSGPGRLDHPSLATPLPDGTISINDDFRHRLVIVDPATNTIVWQYGTTDQPGSGAKHLSVPDGHEPLPAGLAF
jgi:outer membrane protein assembly factor BamB